MFFWRHRVIFGHFSGLLWVGLIFFGHFGSFRSFRGSRPNFSTSRTQCTRGGFGEVSSEPAGKFRALGASSGVFWLFLGHFRSVSGHFWVISVRLSSVVPVVVPGEIFKSFLASLAANPLPSLYPNPATTLGDGGGTLIL